jgi:hypothetical protein
MLVVGILVYIYDFFCWGGGIVLSIVALSRVVFQLESSRFACFLPDDNRTIR